MHDNWVVHVRTQSSRNLWRFHGRSQESWDHSTSAILHSDAASHKHPKRSITRSDLSQKNPHQRSPYAPKIWGSVSRRHWETRAMCPRSRVEIGQEYLKAHRKRQSYILLTDQRMMSSSAIRNKTGGKRICCRFAGKTWTLPNWKPQGSLKSPTTVVTANGEVQTKEEATVHVKELDFFVAMNFLEDTSAVHSLGKLREDHGYSFTWTRGQKPQLNQ